MESIGAQLKQEREKRSLSHQQVFEGTRITVENLSALEEDRFDYFPNRVYARAFLRDYANFLGLDSANLLSQYEDEWNVKPIASPVAKSARSVSPRRVAWLPITAVMVVLAAGAYYLVVVGPPSFVSPAIPTHQRQRTTDIKPTEIATIPKLPQVKPDKPVAVPDKPPVVVAPADRIVLNVASFKTVWLRITVDGKVTFIGNLEPSTNKEFIGIKSVNVRAGKAGAVQLKLNGKLLPSLGSEGQVGDKTFTLADVKKMGTSLPATPAVSPTVVQ